jgi:hypothetical protein
MFRRRPHRPVSAPPGDMAHRRVRRMGLRRALEMLEAGERINDRLYHWTIAEPTAFSLRPRIV